MVPDILRKLLLGALLILPTSAAWAVTVYLNGVAITGVPNQTFKNCTVTTDASGNVYIDAPAYKVEAPGAKAAAPVASAPQQAGLAPTQRYWLITERTPEMADYDIDVFVNGKWLRKFLNEEERQVVEISKYFKTGPNKVALMARKRKELERPKFIKSCTLFPNCHRSRQDEREKHHGHGVVGGLSPNGSRGR